MPTKNQLYYGDNLDILRRYVDDESVDLVYLDPPFKSNQDYNVLFAERDGTQAATQIKAFQDTWRWDQAAALAFQETVEQGGAVSKALQAFRTFLGDNDMLAYLSMMAPRLVELRRSLKPTGSIYLHCDPTASHYLKMLMDAVFGPSNFRNEIVWRRTNAHNDPKRFGRVHDTILFYRKALEARFVPNFLPLPSGHVRERFDKQDHRGRYKLENPTGPGPRFGDSGKPWMGFDPTRRNRAWAPPRKLCERLGIDNALPTRKKLDALRESGHIQMPKAKGSIPMVKVYLEDVEGSEGTAFQDIWAYQPYTQGYYHGDDQSAVDHDVAWMGPTSGERLGYQTQKPEGLLARIIESSTDKGAVVLDPFCGCGTAIASAHRLDRLWIGIDITYAAVAVIKRRFRDHFQIDLPCDVIGEPRSLADALELAAADPYQFQWWALDRVDARPAEKRKGADRGIDGRRYFHEVEGGPTEQIVFSVKAGHTGPDHLRDLRGVVERERAAIGVMICAQRPTKAMRTEAASAGVYTSPWGRHPRIQILTVEELLRGEEVKAPPTRQVDRTFKKAPRVAAKVPAVQRLDFEDKPKPAKATLPKRKKTAKAKLEPRARKKKTG